MAEKRNGGTISHRARDSLVDGRSGIRAAKGDQTVKAGCTLLMQQKLRKKFSWRKHTYLQKYVQAVPLYRQEKEYAALGISLSRTTMANWIIRIAASKILPVCELMKSEVLTNHVIHADETVVQVLREKGHSAKMLSRMWVYCAPKVAGHANILFEYTPTRSGENAMNFLGDFSGYLVCDGYDAYNRLKSVKFQTLALY